MRTKWHSLFHNTQAWWRHLKLVTGHHNCAFGSNFILKGGYIMYMHASPWAAYSLYYHRVWSKGSCKTNMSQAEVLASSKMLLIPCLVTGHNCALGIDSRKITPIASYYNTRFTNRTLEFTNMYEIWPIRLQVLSQTGSRSGFTPAGQISVFHCDFILMKTYTWSHW